VGEVAGKAFFPLGEVAGSGNTIISRRWSGGVFFLVNRNGGTAVPETVAADCAKGSFGLEKQGRVASEVRDEVVDEDIVAVKDWGRGRVSWD
jgi:hypothetical protein